MSVSGCSIIDLPKIKDNRGNLTFVEEDNHIPFAVKRVYYLYDVPGGSERGAHAHKKLEQLIIAVSGSFDLNITDGFISKKITLNVPYQGLYLCPMIWRSLENFSSGSVCLVLASRPYEKEDYYREYDDFLLALGGFLK